MFFAEREMKCRFHWRNCLETNTCFVITAQMSFVPVAMLCQLFLSMMSGYADFDSLEKGMAGPSISHDLGIFLRCRMRDLCVIKLKLENYD